MTPDENGTGGFDDDPRLAESLHALQRLGNGAAPEPSEKLAAFLAHPTGGTSAPAAGWGWLMKEKAARLSRAGKVLVIGGGIALAGAVSATAAWQVTSVLPSHDGEAPRHPAPISSPDEHTSGGVHATPSPTAAPGDESTKDKGQGTHGKDASGSSGSGNDQGEDAGKGKGSDKDNGSGKDGSDEGSGLGKHGDDGKAGSGNGGSGNGGSDSGSGDSQGDGGSDAGSGDSQGDGGSDSRSGDSQGDGSSGSDGSGSGDPAPVD